MNPFLPYSEVSLDNGFTLVHKEVRSAPIVAIDIWIHTGAIHDPEPQLGLSHFYEHMFFKGTERHGVGVMDQIITSLGGYNNAATSLDFTHYYVVIPSAGWRQAMDVLIDSLLNPAFDPHEIERERSVVIEEIKRHEDNPWSKIYDEFLGVVFSSNPYQRQVLGDEESLHRITQETFFDYRQNRYRPDNTTVSVVGDVSRDEVQQELERLLNQGSAGKEPQKRDSFPLIDAPDEVRLARDVNQSYYLMGYPTPRLIGTRDEYALDLLSILLGEGRSSRLNRRLHDELGIVSSISCNHWSLVHAGLFMVEAVTEPDKIEQVEEEIHRELDLARDNLTEEEIEKARNMSKTDFAFGNEKVISIANTYGYSRVAATIDHAVRYLEELETITKEDLQDAFDRHLVPQRLCRGILVPKD